MDALPVIRQARNEDARAASMAMIIKARPVGPELVSQLTELATLRSVKPRQTVRTGLRP